MAESNPIGGAETLRKPIERKTLLYVLVAVLIIGVMLSSLVSYLSTSQPSAQPGDVPPSMAVKPQVSQFDHDLKEAGDTIHANVENARKVIALAEALHAHLPPCNSEMRGQLQGRYYVLQSNVADQADVNLVCQEDNQWAVLPPNVSAVQETAEQQKAERSAGAGGGMSPAEKRKQRLQMVFQSSPIPVHFADAVGDQSAHSQQSTAQDASTTDGSFHTPVEKELANQLAIAEARQAPAYDPTSGSQPSQPSAAHDKVPEAIPLGVQLSSSIGPKYPIFEGRVIEGLLANRLMGQQGGFVKVQTTTPVYDWSGQQLLMPPGSLLLGEAEKVTLAGEKRLAVIFHRVIMPDGFSFLFVSHPKGIDQQGATGLTGKVNNHLASLIGTAVMVGAIEGLADFADVGTGTAVVQIQGGVSREGSNEAMQIMQNALNRPPDIAVYEGTRVRVFVAEDQALPAYRNHVVTATIR